jgi:hypothetical protein
MRLSDSVPAFTGISHFNWNQILSINTLQTEIEGLCLSAGARILSGLFAARFAARRCRIYEVLPYTLTSREREVTIRMA